MESFIKEYDFKTKNNQSWGKTEGYWFKYITNPEDKLEKNLITSVHIEDNAKKGQLGAFLEELSNENLIFSYNLSKGAIDLRFTSSSRDVSVESIILRMTSFFKQIQAQPACSICNAPTDDAFSLVNDDVKMVCPHCQETISQKIELNEQEFASIPNRYFSGCIGAILGAFVGSLVWIAIGFFGYIAVIGGIAIALGAIKGYTLFKGKITKFSVLILIVVCLTALIFAQVITLDIEVYKVLSSQGITFSEVLAHSFMLPFLDPQITNSFVRNLLIGLVFLALGSFRYIKQFFKSASNPSGSLKRV